MDGESGLEYLFELGSDEGDAGSEEEGVFVAAA